MTVRNRGIAYFRFGLVPFIHSVCLSVKYAAEADQRTAQSFQACKLGRDSKTKLETTQ